MGIGRSRGLTVAAIVGLVTTLLVVRAHGGSAEAPEPVAKARPTTCQGQPGWVATWASGVGELPQGTPHRDGFADETLRQIVHVTLGGSAVRVTLTGPSQGPPLQVDAASVALSSQAEGTGPGLREGSRRPLTFGGAPTVRVAAGQRVVSDPVDLAVPDDHDLAISLFFAHPTGPPAGHVYGGETSWVGPGNLVGLDSGTGFRGRGGEPLLVYPFAPSYFVTGVDVVARGTANITILGDSLSDGYGFVWPPDHGLVASEQLFRRLARHTPNCLAVTNVALAGNPLLVMPNGFAPADDTATGVGRLDRDALDRPGIRVLVVALGTNDIAVGRRPAEEVEAALEDIIRRAHAAGIEVVGATIPPLANVGQPPDPRVELTRRAINARIRPTQHDALDFDAVLDMEGALRDPAHPERVNPRYSGCAFGTCGQWHPSPAGHWAVAQAFDPDSLRALAGQ
jgi:lysophospholipase L1-like esterase